MVEATGLPCAMSCKGVIDESCSSPVCGVCAHTLFRALSRTFALTPAAASPPAGPQRVPVPRARHAYGVTARIKPAPDSLPSGDALRAGVRCGSMLSQGRRIDLGPRPARPRSPPVAPPERRASAFAGPKKIELAAKHGLPLLDEDGFFKHVAKAGPLTFLHDKQGGVRHFPAQFPPFPPF